VYRNWQHSLLFLYVWLSKGRSSPPPLNPPLDSKRKLRKVSSFEVKCNNEVIQHVKSVKYLGLKIDNDLTGDNIDKGIVKKENSRLRFIFKHKNMLSFNCRKTLWSV